MEQEDEAAAASAAAAWSARLQSSDVTASDRADFRRWLAVPCNASAWQRLLRVERLAAALLRSDPRFAPLRQRALAPVAGSDRNFLARLQRHSVAVVVLLGLAAMLAAVRQGRPADADPVQPGQVACTRQDAPAQGRAAAPGAAPGPAEPGLESSLYAG